MRLPGPQCRSWWVGMLMGTVCCLVLASVVVEVAGHSWIACTDYRIEKPSDENYYNPDNCKGYPRGFSKFDRGFGRDMGYNNQVPPGAKLPQPCHPRAPVTQPLWDAYTDAYPMAQYAPGQNVCLAWPSKNHVAATCTNQWIPDLGNQLFMSKKNPTRDPTQAEFEGNLLADLGKNPAGKIAFQGFQHCPKFCEDNDKSLCTGCFTVPKNIEPGIYTIEWYWTFTSNLAYTSCFEVMIGKPDGAKRSGGAGSPGDNSKVDVSKTPDTLAFKKVPAQVPLKDFQIDVVYNAVADRQLIVELWSGILQKIPAMTGSVSVKAGYRTISVKVSPIVKGVDPKEFTGMQLTLRAYLVSAEDYRSHPFNPSSFEIYRKEAIVTLGDSLSYSTNQEEGVEDAPPSDDDDSASKWWIVLGVGLGVAAVVAAVAGYLLHKRRRKIPVTIEPSGDYRLMTNA